MTAIEVKEVLANNRQLAISYFNENVKRDSFYNLSWFMTRILQESEIVWRRRKKRIRKRNNVSYRKDHETISPNSKELR